LYRAGVIHEDAGVMTSGSTRLQIRLPRGTPERAVHGTPIRVVLSELFVQLDRA